MTIVKPAAEHLSWYTMTAEAAAERLGVSPDRGLDADEVTRRLAEYGPERAADRAAAEPSGRWPGGSCRTR